MFETIADQRRFADRIVLAGLWLLAPIVAISAALSGGAWIALGLAAVGVGIAAAVVRRTAPGARGTRIVLRFPVGGEGETKLSKVKTDPDAAETGAFPADGGKSP